MIRRLKYTIERSDRPGIVTHQRLVVFDGGVVEFRWDVKEGQPEARDLATHSRQPLYVGMKDMGICHHVMVPCFYDGTSLGAQRMLAYIDDDGAIFSELEVIGRGVWQEKAGYLSAITMYLAATSEGEEAEAPPSSGPPP